MLCKNCKNVFGLNSVCHLEFRPRIGSKQIFRVERKNEFSFVFLAGCLELAMNNHRYSIWSTAGGIVE